MAALDLLDILLVAMGLFYVVGAVLVGRKAQVEALLDSAIAAIKAGQPDRLDVERTFWLFGMGAVVGLGGLMLLIDCVLAVPVFIIGGALQAVYLLWLAPRRYDRVEPVAPADRARSFRALTIYLAAGVLVLGSALAGQLLMPDEVPPWALALVCGGWLGWALWVGRSLVGRHAAFGPPRLSAPEDEAEIVVRVTPAFAPTCLFDQQTGRPLWGYEVETLFPQPLLDQAHDYMLLYRQLADPHDPGRTALRDPAFQDILDREGEALAQVLEGHRPGRVAFDAKAPPWRWDKPFGSVEVSTAHWGYPLSTVVPGDDEPRGLNPDWIDVSWALNQDLEAWARAFSGFTGDIYDSHDPDWSPVEAARHAEWGRVLACRLADELAATQRGHIVVTFRPFGGAAEAVPRSSRI